MRQARIASENNFRATGEATVVESSKAHRPKSNFAPFNDSAAYAMLSGEYGPKIVGGKL